MSGDSQRSDDPDFLDDDFVIEDIAGKNDDLDQLFTTPGAPASKATKPGQPAAEATADADDLLFTDHTQGLQPSEKFTSTRVFAEDERSAWNGDNLELDEVGVPEPEAAAPADPALAAAEEQFASELGSMLRGEEDFALDSESELELVDGATSTDGVSEIEQSGPFVLDDGEGAWQEDAAATVDGEAVPAAAEAVGEAVGASIDGEAEAAATDDEQLPALAEDEAPIEPGWEPLPATDVDNLSEVGEVARVDDAAVDGEPVEVGLVGDGELVGAAANAAAADGHDLYASEAAAPVLIGPRAGSRRGGGLVRFLAAAVLLLGATGVAVLRPEWLGLAIEPERVQQVQIERPKIDVAMTPPVVAPTLVKVDTTKPTKPTDPANPANPGTDPKTPPTTPEVVAPSPLANGNPPAPTKPETPPPADVPPVAVNTPPVAVEPSATAPSGDVPPNPVRPETVPPTDVPPTKPSSEPVAVQTPTLPVATEPTPPSQPPVAVEPANPTSNPSSPVAVVTPPSTPEAAAKPPEAVWPVAATPLAAPLANAEKPRLVRVGDDLMLGDVSEPKRPVNVVDGVLPGSRAFAQLHNGNYFIGSIKCADRQSITLRVGEGEVTLATADVARLTELGSTDYEDLQKATSGFVRLTNNNRLVGGILSRIADDHIVLEFRSNRVMLPRSAIGEVVQGEGDAGVRLDVTREEDDWVRQLAERQLGTGAGPALVPERVGGEPRTDAPAPNTAATPAAKPTAKPTTTPKKPKAGPSNPPAAPAPGRHR